MPSPGPSLVHDKLGGLPWGLNAERWPRCADCGRPQSHLATLLHDGDRLDLGGPDRVLMVFQCEHDPGMCDTWSLEGGGSTAFVTTADALGTGCTAAPGAGAPLGNEGVITAWVEADDGVYLEQYDAFFREDLRSSIDRSVLDGIHQGTKLGGVPFWIQGADDGPGVGWRYVAQLDSVLRFAVDPGRAVRPRRVGTTWHADGPGFGDMGLAYIFVSDTGPPEARVLWQCG